MALIVTSNGHERDLVSWNELNGAERAHIDYLGDDMRDAYRFFHYLGSVYDVGDMQYRPMVIGGKEWHSSEHWTYFSGIVVRLCDDNEHVIVGTYFANEED